MCSNEITLVKIIWNKLAIDYTLKRFIWSFPLWLTFHNLHFSGTNFLAFLFLSIPCFKEHAPSPYTQLDNANIFFRVEKKTQKNRVKLLIRRCIRKFLDCFNDEYIVEKLLLFPLNYNIFHRLKRNFLFRQKIHWDIFFYFWGLSHPIKIPS